MKMKHIHRVVPVTELVSQRSALSYCTLNDAGVTEIPYSVLVTCSMKMAGKEESVVTHVALSRHEEKSPVAKDAFDEHHSAILDF